MSDLNVLVVSGHIAGDIEIKTTPSGTAWTQLRFASNGVRKVDGRYVEDTTWLDVVCWGKNAENVAKFCGRGSKLQIVGALQYSQWTDEATEQKRSRLRVRASEIHFLSPKKEDQAAGSKREPELPVSAPASSNDEPFDDDIPF